MAMVITMLLDSEPIYETLKRRMLERQTKVPSHEDDPKIELSY
jgi:hypothetical protein